MSTVSLAILYVFTLFVVFPFIFTGLVYVLNKVFGVHPLKSFHRSMAWSTIFYIFAVTQMFSLYFGRFLIGLIACIFLLTLSAILIMQHKKERTIHFKRAIRLVWRMSFLLFIVLYIVLVMYGIIIRL